MEGDLRDWQAITEKNEPIYSEDACSFYLSMAAKAYDN